MAYSSEVLVSQRMRNLLACALGGSVAATSTAIDANTENIQSTGTGVMFLPNGQLSAAVAAAELDLSDTAVCAEAGTSIPAGRDFCIFVIQDGTNVLCRLGDERRVVTRSGATGALTTTITRTHVPADLDNETYVVTGFVHCVNATNAFVVGTTGFDAAGVTDTYYDTSNMLAGSKAV